MRRYIIAIVMLFLLVLPIKAAIHWDFDYEGATLAEATYKTLAGAEGLNTNHLVEILNHYTSAEVASAGIWTSKFLERRSLKDVGLFSSQENQYYKVILFMVEKRITPRLIRVGRELLNYPEQFLYWGPYLFKTCEDVMNLCAQFEAIVTNGKMSFSGVKFLSLNSDLKRYFDLSKLGDVNWQQMWDNITNIPSPSWEDFREDFKKLFDQVSPVNLAVAGGEGIVGHASHIFDRFAEAPNSIPQLLSQVEEAFKEVSSGAAVTNILRGVLGDLKDSLAVNKLFDLGQYNVGAYINDYVSQLYNEFYTQLWYIYHYEQAHPASSYYTQMYYICYYTKRPEPLRHIVFKAEYDSRTRLSDFEKELVKKQKELQKMYPKTKLRIETDPPVAITNGGGDEQYEVIDYEALFDSRTNHEVVFEKEFEQRRKTLEDTIEYLDPLAPRIHYYIGKKEKHYYQLESAQTVQNTGSASFTVTCQEELEMVKGGFNFKVNERYNPSKINDYAYPTGSFTDKEPEDVSAWEEKIEDLQAQIDKNNKQIDSYQAKINQLQVIADTTTNEANKQRLLYDISNYRLLISNLEIANENLQAELKEVNDIMEEYEIDYCDDLDGPYRIIHVENDMAGDFRLHWDDEGRWSGHTYIRHAHIVGMENGVTFIAEVSELRGEKRFMGIRYHRAIIGVEFKLISENETSEIVDVIKFTDEMSDEEKADLINKKRNDIQQEFPKCEVTVVKSEKDGIEKEGNEEAFHLLWMSDRVALARFIEYRLRQIDGQLSLIERNLHTKRSILKDFKKAFFQPVPRWRTSKPAGAALQRWIDAGTGNIVSKQTN